MNKMYLDGVITVNSREELENLGEVIFNENHRIILANYGAFYLKNDVYPKHFEYNDPWDSHCCPDYFEITNEEYKSHLKKKVEELTKEIEYLNKRISEIE